MHKKTQDSGIGCSKARIEASENVTLYLKPDVQQRCQSNNEVFVHCMEGEKAKRKELHAPTYIDTIQ